jgi:hypothetical protein
MRQLTQLAGDLYRQRPGPRRPAAPSGALARASPGPAAARPARSLDHARALITPPDQNILRRVTADRGTTKRSSLCASTSSFLSRPLPKLLSYYIAATMDGVDDTICSYIDRFIHIRLSFQGVVVLFSEKRMIYQSLADLMMHHLVSKATPELEHLRADAALVARASAANIRRSEFLPERWKRLRAMVDKVERTVSEYAWLCIKRAHVQRPLFGNAGRLPGPEPRRRGAGQVAEDM